MMSTETNTVMTFLKFLLLIMCSVFTAAHSSTQSENEKCTELYCLPSVVPIHYDIELMLHKQSKNYFNGKTNITIMINHYTQNIILHSQYLHINKKKTKLISKNDIIYKPMRHAQKHDKKDVLILYFDHLLYPGTYILSFKYYTSFSNALFKTVHRTVKNDRRLFFGTNFTRTGARRVFPCWDEPALKATFNISVKHHRNYRAFSNMPIRLQQFNNTSNRSIWSYFETTPLMSTYLVGIAVFNVRDFTNNNKSNFNIWYRKGLDSEVTFAKYIVDKVANQLTDYTKSSFKLPKLDIILTPNDMQLNSWGLILFKESLVTYNEIKESVNHKINVARRIACVMTHQWFEAVVSPTSWSYDWLNEGLASFFQEYTLNQIYKEWQLIDLMVDKLHKSFYIDSNPLNELDSVFHKNKGQILLRILQFMVSDEVFREGIITYLHKHQFDSATPHDLWDAMQNALNKMSYDTCGNIEIENIMESWVKETSYPIIEVTRQDNNVFVITQKCFREYEIEEKKEDIDMRWWISVTDVRQNCPNVFHIMNMTWMDSTSSVVLNNRNDWSLFNIQQAEYVDYNNKSWEIIANFINSPNVTKADVVTRVRLINSAYHFLVEKNFDFIRFLNVVRYLSKEIEYVPWLSMFTILSDMSKYFSIQMEQVGILKSYILAILNGLLRNIGYEDNPTDSDVTKLMRATALSWACNFNDIECTRLAVIKMQHRIANFIQYMSVMSHEKWIYCSALKTANFTTWKEIMHLCYITPNVCMNTCLEVLTCSEKSEIIIEYLKTLWADKPILPITELQQKRFFNILITKYIDNNAVLDYVLQERELWSSNQMILDMIPDMISNAYSEKQLRKIYNVSMKYNGNSEIIMRMITMRTTYLNDITSIIFRNVWHNLQYVNKSSIKQPI